jgi:hypothetical protein
MTALCGGGTSGPKLITDAVAAYGAGRLTQLLIAGGVSELSAFLPVALLAPIAMSAFCSSDPPSMTALTSDEATALATQDFGPDYFNAVGKVKDILLNLVWNDACQCTSGTYTAPVPPASPTDIPVVQPPTPSGVLPCVAFGPTSAQVIGAATSFNVGGPAYLGLNASQIIIDSHAVVVTVDGGWNLRVIFPAVTSTGFAGLTLNFTRFAGDTQTVLAVPPGSTSFNIVEGANGTANAYSGVTQRWRVFCNGDQPTGVQSPCCPPDQSTQNYLDLILKAVTLIQRQAVPFGYIATTAHSGLSGAGSFDIQGLIGVKIDVTTIPTPIGREGTSPTEYFDMGFVTFGTPDGYPQAIRLERESQVALPARCSAFTVLAYDLHPSVVATITELVREP